MFLIFLFYGRPLLIAQTALTFGAKAVNISYAVGRREARCSGLLEDIQEFFVFQLGYIAAFAAYEIDTRIRVDDALKESRCGVVGMAHQKVGLNEQTGCGIYSGDAYGESLLFHNLPELLGGECPLGLIYGFEDGKPLGRMSEFAGFQVCLQSLGNYFLEIILLAHLKIYSGL